MKKLCSISSLVLAIMFLMSNCGEVDCPGFPSAFLNWMPYSISDTIRFSDGDAEIAFIFKHTSITIPYSYRKNCKCECGAYANFESSQFDTGYVNLNGSFSTMANKVSREFYVDCHLSFIENEFYFGITANQDSFYFNRQFYPMSDTLILGRSFKIITLAAESNTSGVMLNPDFKIRKIVYAEGLGLIRFVEMETLKEWKLSINSK